MNGDRRNRPPVPALIGALTEPVYRAVVGRRNRSFESGKRVERVDRPVISVGNLSVGGTGKTPMVAAIVRMLESAGHRPGIAMRGYKAEPGAESDEQVEYRASCPGVPVAADAKRVDAARALIREHSCTCIVLDDGFQHRFLHRDLDIVLLDATRSVFEDHCLPRGWLREPVASLARADAVVLTHAESVAPGTLEALRERVRRERPSAVVASASHVWDAFRDRHGAAHPIGDHAGSPITLASGIGNPSAFEQMARDHRLDVRAHLLKPDHHHWTRADLDELDTLRANSPVLTTQKDWVKIRSIDHPVREHTLVAELTMRLTDGEDDLRSAVLAAAGPA